MWKLGKMRFKKPRIGTGDGSPLKSPDRSESSAKRIKGKSCTAAIPSARAMMITLANPSVMRFPMVQFFIAFRLTAFGPLGALG